MVCVRVVCAGCVTRSIFSLNHLLVYIVVGDVCRGRRCMSAVVYLRCGDDCMLIQWWVVGGGGGGVCLQLCIFDRALCDVRIQSHVFIQICRT